MINRIIEKLWVSAILNITFFILESQQARKPPNEPTSFTKLLLSSFKTDSEKLFNTAFGQIGCFDQYFMSC